ncbi:hypothetical protein COLO4_27154 [Corchorus olitorius]|uniref:Uncharacterized protein n=1 Tax=Corchorus olitorius TaxID=93759 RepID=A0A1R3HSE5_9ROSI|nr:hypothetical protein COLO4_27154 [Corchorus olitorius]
MTSKIPSPKPPAPATSEQSLPLNESQLSEFKQGFKAELLDEFCDMLDQMLVKRESLGNNSIGELTLDSSTPPPPPSLGASSAYQIPPQHIPPPWPPNYTQTPPLPSNTSPFSVNVPPFCQGTTFPPPPAFPAPWNTPPQPFMANPSSS